MNFSTLDITNGVAVTAFDIAWDSDDVSDIPKTIDLVIPADIFAGEIVDDYEQIIDDYISDEISNESGFCHAGFEYKFSA